jgi:uncharacterized membrane protein YhaH (DUF805 family)
MFGHALSVLPLISLADGIRRRITIGELTSESAAIAHVVVLLLAVIVVVFTLTVLAGGVNIIAKRTRDIGFVALLPSCAFLALVGLREVYGSSPYTLGLSFVLILVLAAIPTDALRFST